MQKQYVGLIEGRGIWPIESLFTSQKRDLRKYRLVFILICSFGVNQGVLCLDQFFLNAPVYMN